MKRWFIVAALAAIVAALSPSLFAQWPLWPIPGVPKGPDGKDVGLNSLPATDTPLGMVYSLIDEPGYPVDQVLSKRYASNPPAAVSDD